MIENISRYLYRFLIAADDHLNISMNVPSFQSLEQKYNDLDLGGRQLTMSYLVVTVIISLRNQYSRNLPCRHVQGEAPASLQCPQCSVGFKFKISTDQPLPLLGIKTDISFQNLLLFQVFFFTFNLCTMNEFLLL